MSRKRGEREEISLERIKRFRNYYGRRGRGRKAN